MTNLLWVLSSLVLVLPIPAAIWLRRGWLVLAVIGWLLLPVLVFAVMVGLEAQSGPPNPDAARNAWLGFVLLSGIFVLPWLGVSALLWGVGLLLRRRMGPHAVGAAGAAPMPAWDPSLAPVPAPPGPPRFAAWRSALAILLGAVALIALATWLTPRTPTPMALDRVPAFTPPGKDLR